MNHEIAGPEVTQVTGQLRIPKDIATRNHIAQFWDPRMDDDHTSRPEANMERTSRHKEEILRSVLEAQSIHAVKRAAACAYLEILPDKAYQSSLQQAVRQRKSELRSKRV